ncbi:MAG TPA: universal stress protein [Gammaproteobacteria bacterium]|jgi:universal stress protein A|nr:universal stress protein [Gammaproteobacteria bacterium]
MDAYNQVLIAVDLSEDSARVVQRGMEIARRYGAKASLLHVVEFIPVDPAGEALLPPPVDLEGEMVGGARRRLDELCTGLGLADLPRRLEVGIIKLEILRIATELKADLIVLGSHERHGLALLLGSTEKAIMHKAPCDVLTVRLR